MSAKSMDIMVAHPYKHHVFHLAAGCLRASPNTMLYVPLYMKGFGSLVELVPGSVGARAGGYWYENIPKDRVSVSFRWQLAKLVSLRRNPRTIEKSFDAYLARRILSGELRPRILVTLQDHLSQTMAAAKHMGIKTWSDQIVNMSEGAQLRIKNHCASAGMRYEFTDETRNNRILAEADAITYPSSYVLSGIEPLLRTRVQLAATPYGVDESRFNGTKVHRTSETILVLVRANSVRKGGHLALRAIEQVQPYLKRIFPALQTRFFFLGEMENVLLPLFEEVKKVADVSSGSIPHTEMPHFLQDVDLLLMPSLSEGMSLLIPEVMAKGIPVLATEYCGIDYLRSGVTGLLIKDSVESICDGLVSALHRRSEWGEWGRQCSLASVGKGWENYESRVCDFASNLLKEWQ